MDEYTTDRDHLDKFKSAIALEGEIDALRERVSALEAERDELRDWRNAASDKLAAAYTRQMTTEAERDAARAEAGRLREARAELVSAARFVLRVFTGQPFDRGEYADALNALVTAMTPQEFEGTFQPAPLPFETPNEWDDDDNTPFPLTEWVTQTAND